MDLPGRPGGDAEVVRAGARAWDHLAWEVWHLTRPLEKHIDALMEGWSGPAADAYRARWDQVRRGLGELDHRVHATADHLRTLAGQIEDAQSGYDHVLAAAGIVTVAGIGLTLVTGGFSDVASVEADGALAASAAGMVAQFGLVAARFTALITEQAELLGALASRFAMDFAIKGPELAYGPAGGGAIGVVTALASAARDPAELAASGLLAAAENTGGGRRGGDVYPREEEIPVVRPARQLIPADATEQAWRATLSPAQAAKQTDFDAIAAAAAEPVPIGSIKEPLKARVAAAIHAEAPGTLQFVDRQVMDRTSASLNALTDIDIETDTVAIQLKSGGTSGLSTQMAKTRVVTGKMVVALAPIPQVHRPSARERDGSRDRILGAGRDTDASRCRRDVPRPTRLPRTARAALTPDPQNWPQPAPCTVAVSSGSGSIRGSTRASSAGAKSPVAGSWR